MAFDPVIARAMEKRPSDRFETAGELGRAALEAAAGGGAPAQRPPAAAPGRVSRTPAATTTARSC